MMKNEIRELLDELRSGLLTLYGPRLRGVYLYGSYARGEQDSESDVDVIIVLDDVGGYGAEIDRTGPLVSTLSLRYETSISRVFVSESDWLGGKTAFLAKARREALVA